MLKQHLALALARAVQRGGKHQFAARQKQAKEDLVGQRGALDVAGAQTEAHRASVGGDQAQTVPTRHKAIVLGALNHPVVEQRDGRQGQLGARLGEGLFRDFAHQLSLVVQMRKKLIEFGLNALAHTAEHQRDQGRQGQLALAREGAGMIGMGRVQEKFARAQARGKIAKK